MAEVLGPERVAAALRHREALSAFVGEGATWDALLPALEGQPPAPRRPASPPPGQQAGSSSLQNVLLVLFFPAIAALPFLSLIQSDAPGACLADPQSGCRSSSGSMTPFCNQTASLGA